MQSMYSNCYDETIAALREKASTLRSKQRINVIAKAIESLELKRNMSTVEDDLSKYHTYINFLWLVILIKLL
jgi:hypothetical protein